MAGSKFDDVAVQTALLAYPIFSNGEIAEVIGCSIVWLEKLSQKHGVSKGDYFFSPGQSGYPIDLTGYRFGDLTVIEATGKKEKNNTMWSCQCSCGKRNRVRACHLRKGTKTQCGNCEYRVPERRRKRGEVGAWVWSKIKGHARERNIPVLVDCDYIVKLFADQNGKCALSGVDLEFPDITRNGATGTASLDRIRSDLPYEDGNLQWVHKRVNLMKHNLPEDDFIALCRAITEHQSAKSE